MALGWLFLLLFFLFFRFALVCQLYCNCKRFQCASVSASVSFCGLTSCFGFMTDSRRFVLFIYECMCSYFGLYCLIHSHSVAFTLVPIVTWIFHLFFLSYDWNIAQRYTHTHAFSACTWILILLLLIFFFHHIFVSHHKRISSPQQRSTNKQN